MVGKTVCLILFFNAELRKRKAQSTTELLKMKDYFVCERDTHTTNEWAFNAILAVNFHKETRTTITTTMSTAAMVVNAIL